ncbi:MAG: hypothetical protein QNM02_08245, partial [Acidimicrobiia bacterium]|nr:hypothetical protein [Acidimicrobiia bacterium]
VEEQFYVVWPLVIIGAVWVSRRSGWSARLTIGAVAAAAAVGSTIWAWWLATQQDVQLDRLYFGTDTRGVGCVAGCVLARGVRTGERHIGPIQTGLAGLGAAVLIGMLVLIDGSERWLYGLGFAVIASLAIVNAAAGQGPVGRVLGVRPLAGIGRVSYGVYLWHWPVIVVLDEEATGLSGPALGAVWVSATAALVAASWFVVERRAPLPVLRRPAIAAGYVLVAVAIGAAAIVVANVDQPSIDADEINAPPPIAGPSTTSTEPGRPATSNGLLPNAAERPATEPRAGSQTDAQPTSTIAPPSTRPVRLLVLGDSVAESLGAGPEIPVETNGVQVEVTNRSVVACPVLWQGKWAFDDGRSFEGPVECQGDDRFSDVVTDVDPDVILLMFGWPGTISGWQFDDGTVVAPCEPGFDEAFGDEYDALVGRLESTAQVVVATVAPPSEFGDQQQSDRPACINRELRERDFRIFEFGEWLCPGGDCTQAAPLRRDTIHFANAPAVLDAVWPVILSETMTAAGY